MFPFSTVRLAQADDADNQCSSRDDADVEPTGDGCDDNFPRFAIRHHRDDQRHGDVHLCKLFQPDAVLQEVGGILGGVKLDQHKIIVSTI